MGSTVSRIFHHSNNEGNYLERVWCCVSGKKFALHSLEFLIIFVLLFMMTSKWQEREQ